MQEQDIQLSKVKEVVDLADKHKLAELTVTQDELTITVRRTTSPQPPQAIEDTRTVYAENLEEFEALEAEETREEQDVPVELSENIHEIIAPLVGVFYRAPSPDAPSFVEVGDRVEPGQELGLIEAMKVFSSVPSEVSGTVVEIAVENGQLVHQGDVLVRIELAQ